MSCNRPERCIISEGLGFRVSAAVGGQKHPEKHSKVPNPEAQLRSPCTIRCTTDEAISSRQKGPYHIRSTPHSHENPGMCFAMLLNRLNTWSGTGAFWRVCRDCVDCETSSITALGAGVWLFGILRTHDLQPVPQTGLKPQMQHRALACPLASTSSPQSTHKTCIPKR